MNKTAVLGELAETVEHNWDHGLSVADMLGAVAHVCNEKADFVWETHHNKVLRKGWAKMAAQIEKAAEKVGKVEKDEVLGV